MRRFLSFRSLTLAVLVMLILSSLAHAEHGSEDRASPNMAHVANVPTPPELSSGPSLNLNTDLAFWGNLAFAGNYNGFRIIDISDPTHPKELTVVKCRASQGDLSVWRHEGRLLLFQSIDRPVTTDDCAEAVDTPIVTIDPGPPPVQRFAPGFEGIRIFDVTDPASPAHIASAATACGSHTHTIVPDEENDRVFLYVSSYPIGASQTPPEFPEFDGPRCEQPHNKISIVEVDLSRPDKPEVEEQPLDEETRLYKDTGAKGCHDIQVFLELDLAAAACLSEGQLWDISDPAHPETTGRDVVHVRNPAVNFWHNAAFTWDGRYVTWMDEWGGGTAHGCEGTDDPRGNAWIHALSDPTVALGRFMLPRAQPAEEACTVHNNNFIPVRGRYLLTSAWYQGGLNVADFTNPEAPVETGFFEAQGVDGRGKADIWSAYWYNGFIYANDGLPGAGSPPIVRQDSRGFDVYRFTDPSVEKAKKLDHLNPQTQERVLFRRTGR
jgi:hypothetical protein